jgi:hypothetical protein
MRHLFAALLLASCLPASAEDSGVDLGGAGIRQGAADSAPRSRNPAASPARGSAVGGARESAPAARSASGRASSAAAPAAAAEAEDEEEIPPAAGGEAAPLDFSKLKFTTYKRLAEMERHGSHGAMRVSGPNQAFTIGFPSGESGNGQCAVGRVPWASPDGACQWHLWVTDRPGGRPLKDCYMGPLWANVGASLTWVVGKPTHPGQCVVQKGRRYYCGFTATGFERDDEHKPKKCDTGLANPISLAPDED